jgi:hypothetical protein
MEDDKCLWNTSLHTAETKQPVKNATQEIVRDLNFPELTVRGRKFENQKLFFVFQSEPSRCVAIIERYLLLPNNATISPLLSV